VSRAFSTQVFRSVVFFCFVFLKFVRRACIFRDTGSSERFRSRPSANRPAGARGDLCVSHEPTTTTTTTTDYHHHHHLLGTEERESYRTTGHETIHADHTETRYLFTMPIPTYHGYPTVFCKIISYIRYQTRIHESLAHGHPRLQGWSRLPPCWNPRRFLNFYKLPNFKGLPSQIYNILNIVYHTNFGIYLWSFNDGLYSLTFININSAGSRTHQLTYLNR